MMARGFQLFVKNMQTEILDIYGTPVQIGDIICFAGGLHNMLSIAKVLKFTPKSIKVLERWSSQLKMPEIFTVHESYIRKEKDFLILSFNTLEKNKNFA